MVIEMNIDNFGAGILSAAAFTPLRDISAQDAGNVRHSDIDGALIVRPGYRRSSLDAEPLVAIFAHVGYILVLTAAGELKWESEQRVEDTEAAASVFRPFMPDRTGFETTRPTNFIASDNDVFVSNSNALRQLKIVFRDGLDPEAVPFYIPPLRSFTVTWTGTAARAEFSRGRVADTGPEDDGRVWVRFQPIKTLSQNDDDPSFYPIEAVGKSSVIRDKVPVNTVLTAEIVADVLDPETDADYIDVFQSLTTAENAYADFYFVGRFPYAVGSYVQRIFDDLDVETARVMVEPIDEPIWQLSEITNERLYLNSGRDNRIWMTYYDTNEKYLRTVTDYYDVNTGGFPITGLKTLQQSVLAVYTENRIFLLNVDPIAELHSVIEIVSNRDDKDAPIGCVAPESLVDIEGVHYFLSPSRQVYAFDGHRVQWVSKSVNPTLVKMPKLPSKKATAFARGLKYCLCYPSTPESTENDALLEYDTQRKLWWKDDLRVATISKGRSQQEYAIIDGWPAVLDTGIRDSGEPIEWFWKGNKILIPLNTLIHSVFIGILPEDVDIELLEVLVTLKTEEATQTQRLVGKAAVNFWEQFLGFNLRGRSVEVTLSGTGVMKIDRLVFNPEV